MVDIYIPEWAYTYISSDKGKRDRHILHTKSTFFFFSKLLQAMEEHHAAIA